MGADTATMTTKDTRGPWGIINGTLIVAAFVRMRVNAFNAFSRMRLQT
jgi:hypothetical protein